MGEDKEIMKGNTNILNEKDKFQKDLEKFKHWLERLGAI